MLVLYGDGGNGRSTVTEPWEAMLGVENVSDVPLEVLGDEYRLWALKGKLANFSGELQYLGKMHEGLIKRVVSGETIEVNRKHKDPAKFRPFAKLIVNTNDMPQIRDTSSGTWDRLITIPFEVRIRDTAKDDKGRIEKLKKELPGIFLWSVRGLKRLLKQGHFTACVKCQSFLDERRKESDTVRLFASECLATDSESVTYSVPLYQFYCFYTRATNRKAVCDSEFGRRMQRLGWVKGREKSGQRRPLYKDMQLSAMGRLYREQALARSELARGDCSTPICRRGNLTIA